MLKYLKYDDLDINEELAKIECCDSADIVLEPTNKKCLFILGMLFVNGVKIKILNESELNLKETNKSFSMMPYVWSKFGDDNFPKKDYSDVKTEMDKRVENAKRIGIRVTKIKDNPVDNKIFLICPVRNATEEQRKWIENFVAQKIGEGYVIHAPHLHTRQSDLFGGYAICKQNAEAVATSEEIDIYYDQSSTGSIFDLGVAYALHKPLRLLNKSEIIFNENDLIDSIVRDWPFNIKYDTLKYYNENAETYCEQTKNGDMKDVYKRFLLFLPDKAYILDFGCGSGRDSKYFLEKGYTVHAMDGSEKMCELASKYIGQKVECKRFDELTDVSTYDGIWACSSILHVEREELPDILKKMIKALKDNGVIYTCFKKGDQCEIKEGKYYNYLTRQKLEKILSHIEPSAEIVDYFENGTCANVNRPTTIWGNYLIKKIK